LSMVLKIVLYVWVNVSAGPRPAILKSVNDSDTTPVPLFTGSMWPAACMTALTALYCRASAHGWHCSSALMGPPIGPLSQSVSEWYIVCVPPETAETATNSAVLNGSTIEVPVVVPTGDLSNGVSRLGVAYTS